MSSNGNNSPAAAGIPPIQWAQLKPEDANTTPEQHQEFLAYYKEKGWAYSEERRMFLPRTYNHRAEYSGETYFRNTRFGADISDRNFVTHTRHASALPELERERLQLLDEAMEKLAEAQRAPDSPDKAKLVRELVQEVRRFKKPLEQFLPVNRSDMDDINNPRRCELPNDIAGGNSRRDTMFKFKPMVERMSPVGALGTEVVIGRDLETVKQNRSWEEGNIWRPLSANKDWEEWADDEPPTSTFHGFIPRHSRPGGIGLGHLGYDSVYTRSRDGVWYTAEDVPAQVWVRSVNSCLKFESQSGSQYVLDRTLADTNMAIKDKKPPKPLAEIIAENKAATAGRAAYRGRGGAGRGAGRHHPQWA